MAGMSRPQSVRRDTVTNGISDEPRRSGRATKGVNTKERDIDEAPAHTPAPKKGKVTKSSRKQVEEESEEDEVTRCVCGEGADDEDAVRAMICCDKCQVWQHNDCMMLAEDYQPDKYFCEQCRPSDHKPLLNAIARGEKPWEEAAKRRHEAEAEKASKKKGKKGRKSADARDSPAVNTTPADNKKRKAEDSPAPSETKVRSLHRTDFFHHTDSLQSSKRARGTPAETNGKTSSRKASQTPSRGPPVADSVKELPQARQGGASSLIKLFIDQTKSAVKAGSLTPSTAPDAHGTSIGLQVEHALYHGLSSGSTAPNQAYKDQLRMIVFNLKKNQPLAVKVLGEEIDFSDLARMTAKDMASEEQQAKDAALVKEMERQHIIVDQGDTGARIRRTHKGEEYVDEERAAPSQPSAPNKEVKAEIKSPTQPNRRQPSVTIPRRQSSATFDINKVYSSVSAQDGEQRFGELPPSGGPVHSPTGPGARADADIDALLKDEEDDDEAEYSPKEYEEKDDGSIWRGAINGGSLGRFNTVAKFHSGATPDSPTLRTTWSVLLPPEIGINGRIQPTKADEYLCGLEFSSSSDMLVIWMAEPTNETELAAFNKFFAYFRSKERFGVGSQHHNAAVKDIYFVPMEKGQEMPAFVKKLENAPSSVAEERGLLVPLVVKNTELSSHTGGGAVVSPDRQIQSPGVGMQTPITPSFSTPQNAGYQGPPNGIPQQDGAAYPASHNSYALPPGQHAPPQQQGQHQHMPPQQTPNFPTSTHVPHSTPHPPSSSTTPYPNQPQQTPAAFYALQILGPQLSQTPAVLGLVTSAPNAGEQEMKVVAEILSENPGASGDLQVLIRALQERHSGGGGQQQQAAQPTPSEANAGVQQPASGSLPGLAGQGAGDGGRLPGLGMGAGQ
jgi:hypothetical protein